MLIPGGQFSSLMVKQRQLEKWEQKDGGEDREQRWTLVMFEASFITQMLPSTLDPQEENQSRFFPVS